MNCRACDRAGSADCSRVFTCTECGEEKNVCYDQTGGFSAPIHICSTCHMGLHGFYVSKNGLVSERVRTAANPTGRAG